MSETEGDTLRRLLFETIESLEELEVLKWFHERGDSTPIDAEFLARQTPIPGEATESAIVALAERGLLSTGAEPHQFAYTPDARTREVVDQIVREYRANPVQIMKIMTENAIERVRTAALRTFAECFRIRGPGSRG